MSFTLPKLDYSYDALEPHIDARTMEIHHSKHHQGYTNKLNAAIEGSGNESMNITDIFIVKYEEHNQTSLEKHVDESTVSVIITLSNINDYEGGGTKFEDDIIVKQNKGDILIFSKLHSHSAISIKKGKRYVLTYFIDIENS